MTDCEAWEQLRPWAHREARTVASVRQLVVAGVEGERLHDVGTGPQELSVQLAHCNADAQLGIRHFPENGKEGGGGGGGFIRFHTSAFTCFGVLGGSLRCPRSCLYVTSLLKGEDEASVPDDDLARIQTLQNRLRAQQPRSAASFSMV